MPSYRVLIVDDSAFMRKVFSDRIGADDDFTVAGTASDGEEAVRQALSLEPDLITMDLEMPRMNGLEALRRIMAVRPTPVIMLSAITDNGTRDTIRALQFGAFDFIHKPDSSVKHDLRQVGDELVDKLRMAMDSVKKGTFRVLPAVEDEAGERQGAPPQAAGGETGVPAKFDSTDESSMPAVSPPAVSQDTSDRGCPILPPPRVKEHKQPVDFASQSKITGPLTAPVKPLEPGAALPSKRKPEPKSRPAVGSPAAATANEPLPGMREKPAAKPAPPPEEHKQAKGSPFFTHVVAIGTSTGGPRALHEVLTGLPAGFEAPVLVVQHMPPKFTFSLAQRLDSFCSIRVREAAQGEQVETATAYIAPGGKHMSLVKDVSGTYRIKLTEEGPRSGHIPSVDILFESLVGLRQLKRHAVLMTGMGSDGAKGMKALQEDGAETRIAEAEETCVVYGMPRSAVELGAVSHQLPVHRIAPHLVRAMKSRSK